MNGVGGYIKGGQKWLIRLLTLDPTTSQHSQEHLSLPTIMSYTLTQAHSRYRLCAPVPQHCFSGAERLLTYFPRLEQVIDSLSLGTSMLASCSHSSLAIVLSHKGELLPSITILMY